MNVKKTLLISFILIVGSFLIVQGVPESEKYGGTLVLHSSQNLMDLNPMVYNDIYSASALNQLFDALTDRNPKTGEIIPCLAKSWEFSEDKKTITYHLREGVEFHNGEKFTAEDVKFTFNWILNPENGSPNRTEINFIEEVTTPDEYTVKITSKEVFAPALTAEGIAIVPKDTFQEMGREKFNNNPVGTGPFKFEKWDKGSQVVLVRNENYWLKKPYLEKIIIRPIPKLATAVLELEKGSIDILEQIPAPDVNRLKKMDEINVPGKAGLNYYWIGFNDAREPTDNKKFRKAVYLSFDIDDAVKQIYGETAMRSYGLVPPTSFGNDREYLKENVKLDENDEKAGELFKELQEEGELPKEPRITIYTPPDPQRMKLATVISTNLILHGIEASVAPREWGTYLTMLSRSEKNPKGKIKMYIIGWIAGGPDPYNFLYYQLHSDNNIPPANNWSNYSNEKVDELIDQGTTTFDREEREEAYVEAQRTALKSYVHIPAYHEVLLKGVRDRVNGYSIEPTGGYIKMCSPYSNVWVEH